MMFDGDESHGKKSEPSPEKQMHVKRGKLEFQHTLFWNTFRSHHDIPRLPKPKRLFKSYSLSWGDSSPKCAGGL